MKPELTPRELATVLAALRHWQHVGMHAAMLDIATDGGKHEPLTETEIDALCERINHETP